MQLFGIPNCSTVKKARDWLNSHNLGYEFHDFKKQGISSDLVSSWLAQMPWEKLVNRTGMTWRNLSEAEKSEITDTTTALNLMLEKPSVIKRPLLVRDGKIICLGFTEATYKEFL